MSEDQSDHDKMVTEVWRNMLINGENKIEKRQRKLFKVLPSHTKCKWCLSPFDGPSASVVKVIFGKHQGVYNPQFCNFCEKFAKEYQGGAEVIMSMLFADIRGSTTLAENMSPGEFSQVIDRFYQATTNVLTSSDAIIDKLSGDEVTGFYVPGLAGEQYSQKAIAAGQKMLRATGHLDPEGPWVPVGIGVHTGLAFCGAVGSTQNVVDITALGDSVNVASRIASKAKTGELLVSEETFNNTNFDYEKLEKRELELKGKSVQIPVRVLYADTHLDGS